MMDDTSPSSQPADTTPARPQAEPPLIVEGVMTTLNDAGQLNLAPMGPRVDAGMTRFVFRPFCTSQTYRNLKATGAAVFHVTDDALLIARAAIGRLDRYTTIPTRPAAQVRGQVLAQACRYHELAVTHIVEDGLRATVQVQVRHAATLRDFLGFNRARHAVIEAAILATRLHLTGSAQVLAEYSRLQVMVEKTGGADEHRAMAELAAHVHEWADRQGTNDA